MSAATAVKGREADKLTKRGSKRTYVRQTDVPRYPLTEALRVAEAISEQYGKQPTKPVDVAFALELPPNSKPFEYRWRPRSGVNGSGRRLRGMLRGSGDGLVDHLLWHGRVEELAA